jgi:hypothetical protein
MLEKEIESTVKRYAESKGWLTRKWVSPGHNFVCDQIFISPTGLVVFCEFKRNGGKPTSGQLREHERLRVNKALVYVIDSVEYGKQVVDELLQRD